MFGGPGGFAPQFGGGKDFCGGKDFGGKDHFGGGKDFGGFGGKGGKDFGGGGKGKKGGGKGGKGKKGGADAKAQRETEYFDLCQQHNAATNRHQNVITDNPDELFNTEENIGVDFSRYDNIEVEVRDSVAEQHGVDAKKDLLANMDTFETAAQQYNFPPWMAENIGRCKYKVPTPIQKYTISVAMRGRDLMSCAQTGSGKTCAFLIPTALQIQTLAAQRHSDPNPLFGPSKPLAVILSPTRELCSQIHQEARRVTFSAQIRCVQVYGGVDAKPQLRELAAGADLITATPGRLKDFTDRNNVDLTECRSLILDEADRMLDMGFEDQIRH
eukprot:g18145.t1